MCWHWQRDATALLIMRQRCQCDATALSTWCKSTVNVMRQRCRSCDITVDHAMVPLLMWQHYWCDATVLSIMQQCRCWCDSAVDMTRQHCQSCRRLIDSTGRWLTAQSHAQQVCWAIDNKVIQRTVSSLNWQWWCCNCVSWMPFVQTYKTGPFLHKRKNTFVQPILAHSRYKFYSNCW